MKNRGALHWIKIGLLIGIGLGGGLLMVPVIFSPIGLVLLFVLLFLFLVASTYTKFREWRMVREAVRARWRRR